MENNSVKPSPRSSATKNKPPRVQLDRNNWIETAIDVLARDGVAGLRVEVLAKRCGVTKGSFYWHFRDRQDLLSAILARWQEGRIRDIEKVTTVIPGMEQERLHYAINVYGANRNRKGMQIELAIRDWARHDPLAAEVVEAVDLYRLECTRRLFAATGMADEEAKSRSLLLYACVFGLSLMHYSRFDANPESLKQRIASYIVSD